MINPMPTTVSAGPASLFGHIYQANTQTLSIIVIPQMADPGRLGIYINSILRCQKTPGCGYLFGLTATKSAAGINIGLFFWRKCYFHCHTPAQAWINAVHMNMSHVKDITGLQFGRTAD
jgi:hypothetical protein